MHNRNSVDLLINSLNQRLDHFRRLNQIRQSHVLYRLFYFVRAGGTRVVLGSLGGKALPKCSTFGGIFDQRVEVDLADFFQIGDFGVTLFDDAGELVRQRLSFR